MELILNFHGVGGAPARVVRDELPYWFEKASFLHTLDCIAESKYTSALQIAITFDDGNASDATVALPGLLERNLTASFFVCAGRIGARHYLDAGAIRALLDAGMSVGSHGMDHVDWTCLSASELDREISGSRRFLQDLCGREVVDAAIPFGRYNRPVLKKLKKEGFRHVYSSDGGFVSPECWFKPRNTLQEPEGAFDLAALIAEVSSPSRRAKGLIKSAGRLFI